MRKIIRRRIRRPKEGEEEFREAITATDDTWAETEVFARPMAAAVVTWLAVVVESILLLRLILRLFAANPANDFVAFIYGLSRPLVNPFFGALGVQLNTGPGAFETATLLAMLVYGVVAYLIVSLIQTISRRRA